MQIDSLPLIVICVALVFDYINGFHDAANSIATVVATRTERAMRKRRWASLPLHWWPPDISKA